MNVNFVAQPRLAAEGSLVHARIRWMSAVGAEREMSVHLVSSPRQWGHFAPVNAANEVAIAFVRVRLMC